MSESYFEKNYEELGFTDYFMFGKVMEDPKLCHDVLECLLQKPIGEIIDNQREKEFRYTKDGKYVKLDIFCRSDKGVSYDAEMENLNGKSFICTFDPFGVGLSQYTFRERCDEEKSLLLCDGTAKYFFNCTYRGGKIPEGIRMLYDYIETGVAGDELTKEIESAVDRGRRNERWRGEYLKERQIIMEEVRAERERADEAEKRAAEADMRAEEERKRANDAEERIKQLEALLEIK